MRRQIPSSVFILGILAASLGTFWLLGTFAPGYGTWSREHAALQEMAKIQVPEITGQTVDGHNFRLSDYKGQVVLLNLWATSCVPCREETPELVALQHEYAARGFTVVGLSEDANLGPVRAFVKDQHISYPVLLADGDQIRSIDTGEMPTSFLIDRNGKVAGMRVGTPQDVSEIKTFWDEKIRQVL